jgi:hypothetical protein
MSKSSSIATRRGRLPPAGYRQGEKSLCAYSVTGFRDNLIAKYPNKSTQITEIIQPYE